MDKNTNAIDKIIKALASADYKAAWTKYPESFKRFYKGFTDRKPRGYYPFGYTLGMETAEAVRMKNDYAAGKASEEEYKAYCLKFNLTR